MRKIKHILTGEEQIILNILFICILFIIPFAYPSFAQQNVEQKATGDQSPNINAPGGKVTINYGISKKSLDEISKLLNGKDKEINRLLKTLDEKDVKIEEREALIQDWIRKYKELEQRLAQRPSEDSLSAQARQKLANGDIEGAEKLLRESLEKNLQDIKDKTKAAAADAYELGTLKELRLDYQGAKIYYEQATRLDPDNRSYIYKFGETLSELGEPREAIKYFSMALDIDLKIHGVEHTNVARDYISLGWQWQVLAENRKALDYFLKALKIDLKEPGEERANVGDDYRALGSVYFELGKHKEGFEYFSKALDIDLKASNGVANRRVAKDYYCLCVASSISGEQKKVMEYASKALDIDLKIYGAIHPSIAKDYMGLGVAWSVLGEHKKAIDYFSKALDIDIKIYGEQHPDVGYIYTNLGIEWRHLGETEKAIDCYSKALDIFTTKYGDDHWMIQIIRSYIEYAKKYEQSHLPANTTKDR
jgi:tetratricopeptide (TPR) repeat protein